MSTTPDHIRQVLTTYIATLVVDTACLTDGPLGVPSTTHGYAQATTDVWREAEEPLVPEMEPATRALTAHPRRKRSAAGTLSHSMIFCPKLAPLNSLNLIAGSPRK